jgi:diaminopimelate epimerase
MNFWKAHAYGNDFLYVEQGDVEGIAQDQLARQLCDRHLGIGADGLIVFARTPTGATMRLFNADGGRAEVSGNGVRALGALLARDNGSVAIEMTIETEGGPKRLQRLERENGRQKFRAAMGVPSGIRQVPLNVAGEPLQLSLVNIGNPHCVLLGPLPDPDPMRRVGTLLERHSMFPNGTNVEFVHVEAPDRLKILIWERGVGPTQSSGTGSCASLVAAAAFGGANRRADVVAPGGPQLVEWLDDAVYLTGWAEVVCEGRWLGALPR